MQLSKIKISIRGVSPLLQNSIDKANPLHPKTKALKALTSKRKKTDEDHAEIMRLEWAAGLYCDDQGPYVPSEWIESVVRGTLAERGAKLKDVALPCRIAVTGRRAGPGLFDVLAPIGPDIVVARLRWFAAREAS